eukprot:2311618-Rhodomonas_salina.1
MCIRDSSQRGVRAGGTSRGGAVRPMSSTDTACAGRYLPTPSYAMSGTGIAYARCPYAMSGTGIADALTQPARVAIPLRLHSAMPGTDAAYANNLPTSSTSPPALHNTHN